MGALVALAGLALLLSACGAGAAPAPSGPAPFDFDALLAEAQATPYQYEMLRDGEVSYDEYRRSFAPVIECLRAEGFDVGPLERQGFRDRFLGFTYGAATDDGLAAADALYNRCYDRYQQHVDYAYYRANRPTEADYDEIVADLARCLRAAGFDVAPGASLDDLWGLGVVDPAATTACFEATGL